MQLKVSVSVCFPQNTPKLIDTLVSVYRRNLKRGNMGQYAKKCAFDACKLLAKQ